MLSGLITSVCRSETSCGICGILYICCFYGRTVRDSASQCSASPVNLHTIDWPKGMASEASCQVTNVDTVYDSCPLLSLAAMLLFVVPAMRVWGHSRSHSMLGKWLLNTHTNTATDK